MRKLVAMLAAALAALLAVLLVNTWRVGSEPAAVEPGPRFPLDEAQATERFAGALRIPTVSDARSMEERAEPFRALHDYLARSFPQAHAVLDREVVAGYSLLYTWHGRDPSLAPVVLMGHLDVVPVDEGTEDLWTHPPFAGSVVDGYLWGRGALDNKVNVLGLLEAVETLIGQGFTPSRTVHLAFGHDEEIGGEGAEAIVELLDSRGVRPLYVLDEGGAVAEGVVSGVEGPVALIGIAEKGYLSLELTVKHEGGHSSMPPRETAVEILSRAVVRITERPFPSGIRGATRDMLASLAPELPFVQRMAVSNLWLFGPVVKRAWGKSARGNALIRTTTAATMLRAGTKDNVLPIRASAVVNFRLLPGDSIQGVFARVRRIIDDPRVELGIYGFATEPSPTSDAGGVGYELLAKTVRRVFPEAAVVPYLVVGGTDARHYARLSRDVFRFTPMQLGVDDFRRFHGTDERLSVESYTAAVRFYAELLSATAGPE